MLNLTEKNKIKGFLADEIMSNAVKNVLRESFLKDRKGDVQMLASQMLAVNLLDEGFKELRKNANQVDRDIIEKEQIAL